MSNPRLTKPTSDLLERIYQAYAAAGCRDHRQWPLAPPGGVGEAAAYQELRSAGFLQPGPGNAWFLTTSAETAFLRGLVPALPTSEQRVVLDLVGDHQLDKHESLLGPALRRRAWEAGVPVDVAALAPWYLDPLTPPPDDRYRLSLWGWLDSKHGSRVLNIADKTLHLFRARYKADDYSAFNWEELKRAGVPEDSDLYLVQEILLGLRWIRGGSPTAWGLPSGADLERLVTYRDVSECLAQLQLAQIRLQYHNAAFQAHVAAAGMFPSGGVPHAVDLLAELAGILAGSPLQINIVEGNVTNFNNSNSNVGAQGSGDHSPVTGNVTVTTSTQTWTQAQYLESIRNARRALVDDEEALGPELCRVLGEVFRRLQAIQVEQGTQADVLARVENTANEVWALHKAEELRPKLLPEGLKFAEALTKSPVLAVLLTLLTGKNP